MIAIVGSEGAQGRRYRAILDFLERPHASFDLFDELHPKLAGKIEGAIIATPTDTHIAVITEWMRLGIPLLVEKPFTKKVADLRRLSLSSPALDFCMVMQYRHVAKSVRKETSWYNYFRHGNDGLIWDCLQPIALSRSDIKLGESSPIWECGINGERLNIADMDRAYVLEVEDWLHGRRHGYSELIDIHEKVAAYASTGK